MGLTIAPFREFTKIDYYGYAGAEKIGENEPLIFSGDLCEIVIAGGDDGNGVRLEVYLEDEYYTSYNMKFSKALRLGKKIAEYDSMSMDDLVEFLDEQTDLQASSF